MHKKQRLAGAAWDSVFLTLAKILTMAFGIVLSKIMSVGLSLTEYGTYSAANLVTSVGTSLILLGLVDAVNFYFNKKAEDSTPEERFRIVNTVFFLEIAAGVILAATITLGRSLIVDYFENPALFSLLPIVSLLPVFANLVYFYQMLYVSAGKAKQMSLYNLGMMIAKIVSAYVSVYVLKNIFWIYVVLVLLDAAQILLFKLTLRKEGITVHPFRISPSHIRPILAYSLPMGVYAMTSVLTRDIDKLIVGRLAGTENLAVYTNCSKLLPFDFLAVSFATVLIPYIVQYVTEGNRAMTVKLFSSYIKIGYYSVWILAAAVLIAPESMVSFLYADAYTVGTPIFILYVSDSMLRFASMHLILTAAGKSASLMLYSLISLIVNTGLNIVLYYAIGMIGPAVATLAVAVLYTFLVLRKTIGVIGGTWREIFDLREIALFFLSLAVLWAGGFLLNGFLLTLGVHKYVSMILCAVLFGIAALLLHRKKIFGVLKEINTFKR